MIYHSRRGATLIELVITIAIMGILSGVAGLSLLKTIRPDPGDPIVIADSLRRGATRDGSPKTAMAFVDSVAVEITAFPDGSIVADSALSVDILTGQVARATQ